MQYKPVKNKDGSTTTYSKPLKDGKARGLTYLLLSFWKMFVFFCCFITIADLAEIIPDSKTPRRLFTDFISSFETNQYILSAPGTNALKFLQTDELLREELFWKSQTLVLVVQVGSPSLYIRYRIYDYSFED